MGVPAARAVSRPAPRSPPRSTVPSCAIAIMVIVVVVVIVTLVVTCNNTSQLSKAPRKKFHLTVGRTRTQSAHRIVSEHASVKDLRDTDHRWEILVLQRVDTVSESYLPPSTAPSPGLPSGPLGSTGWNPRHAAQFTTRFLILLALRLMKWNIGLLTPQLGHSLVRPARPPGAPVGGAGGPGGGGGGAGTGAGAMPPAGPPALAISVCDDVWCD